MPIVEWHVAGGLMANDVAARDVQAATSRQRIE